LPAAANKRKTDTWFWTAVRRRTGEHESGSSGICAINRKLSRPMHREGLESCRDWKVAGTGKVQGLSIHSTPVYGLGVLETEKPVGQVMNKVIPH
jgi:hypothetical protein